MIEQGMPAPDFTLEDQNGETVSLKQLAGKFVVLYFYPKALTPGCTTETCNFQVQLPAFTADGAVILGVSRDSVARQKKFADKYDVQFQLLSDEDGAVCEAYGVWQKKKLYGKEFMGIVRRSFLIGPDGRILKTYPKVKVKEHPLEVLQDLKSFQ